MANLAWGPLRSGMALAVCALALAGCSGTRFGDQLSRSFSAPAPQPASPAPAAPKPVTPSRALPKAPGAKPEGSPLVRPLPPATSPSRPAPYRITIQLPSADPAAPAEAVTEALRAAGVSFEVEMIERIGASTSMPAQTTPRASAAPAAPTVTPAPAPR